MSKLIRTLILLICSHFLIFPERVCEHQSHFERRRQVDRDEPLRVSACPGRGGEVGQNVEGFCRLPRRADNSAQSLSIIPPKG